MQPSLWGARPMNLPWLAGVSTTLDNRNFIKCPSPSQRGGDYQAPSGASAARQGLGGFGERGAGTPCAPPICWSLIPSGVFSSLSPPLCCKQGFPPPSKIWKYFVLSQWFYSIPVMRFWGVWPNIIKTLQGLILLEVARHLPVTLK